MRLFSEPGEAVNLFSVSYEAMKVLSRVGTDEDDEDSLEVSGLVSLDDDSLDISSATFVQISSNWGFWPHIESIISLQDQVSQSCCNLIVDNLGHIHLCNRHQIMQHHAFPLQVVRNLLECRSMLNPFHPPNSRALGFGYR